jgi:hypothetical protein
VLEDIHDRGRRSVRWFLRYLFLHDSPPVCLDAADANDSSEVDISDALFLIFHLYQAGAVPPAPRPGSCGLDLTPDPLPECGTAGC